MSFRFIQRLSSAPLTNKRCSLVVPAPTVVYGHHLMSLTTRRRVIMSARPNLFSTSSTESSSSKATTKTPKPEVVDAVSSSSAGIIEGTNTMNLGQVVRHGKGDAYITLNVGGTDFHTLRSTVNSNSVLADHVARAEANKELAKGGAIFIDRNPQNFAFILEFLRNKVDMLKYDNNTTALDSMTLKKFTDTYVRLPEQKDILRDLYIEASYYRIPELQTVLSRSGFLVKIMDLITDGNPFDKATKFLSNLRNFAIFFGAFGGVFTTVFLAAKNDFSNLLVRIGIMSKQEEGEEEENGGSLLETVGLARKKGQSTEASNELELEKAFKKVAQSITK